jgi:hypothetical chaperone protein
MVERGETLPKEAGALGVDFGTTNTVLSRVDAKGEAHLATFAHDSSPFVAFRSALSFHAPSATDGAREVEAGPWAIDAYVEDPLETRFIQSFKSHAASAAFRETRILGRRYTFEDLLSVFLLRLRAHGGGALAEPPSRVIVGRPVNFAGAAPDANLALSRYQEAFTRLGFSDIRYAFEPVAAAFFFARRLTGDATVLVGDFGGGTSDFSIVRFRRRGGVIESQALANAGVGLAGDAFDYRIIDHVVSPELGRGTRYRAFDNLAPIPNRYFTAFAKWEQLALLRASRDMADIRALRRTAVEPDKIAALIEILEDNHGYRLYQSVSALKEALSSSEAAVFRFEAGSVRIERLVTRQMFENWIEPDLRAMEQAVEGALAEAGLEPESVDRVFLTGGTSFVPAVRRLFTRRFGEAKVEGGAELVSIASGLAYMSLEPDLDRWTTQRA